MHNFILRLTVMFPFMSALIGAKTLEPRQSEKLFNKTLFLQAYILYISDHYGGHGVLLKK